MTRPYATAGFVGSRPVGSRDRLLGTAAVGHEIARTPLAERVQLHMVACRFDDLVPADGVEDGLDGMATGADPGENVPLIVADPNVLARRLRRQGDDGLEG